MRTAGMVMGIVGGAIAILLSILLIFGSVVFTNYRSWDNSFYNDDWNYDDYLDSWDSLDSYDYNFDFNNYLTDDIAYNDVESMSQTIAGGIFLLFGIGSAIAGILGLVGGLIVKKKNVAAGVMMIIAAALSLICILNIISMVLFILGGIFALMRDRQQQPQVYMPPYPMPPYYPQQPYPPQQYPAQYPQPQNPEKPAPPDQPQP